MTKNSKVLVIIFGILLVALMSIGYWVKINYFEAGGALVSKYQNVDAAMRLNVQGTDLRVYEFTPQTLPHVRCVFVAGDRKASLACIQKKEKLQ